MADLVQRYRDRILGVLSCYDRVIVRGGIPGLDYAKGMEQYLRAREIRLFDFPKFAMPFREAIGNNAEQLAQANGIKVQFIRHSDVRKEDVVAKVLEQRGDSPGLVAILSALEVSQLRGALRQDDGSHVSPAGSGQVPPLLLQLHR